MGVEQFRIDGDRLLMVDAGGVFHAAQRFGQSGLVLPFFHDENWVAINSPSQFGRYSAAALLDTLPDR